MFLAAVEHVDARLHREAADLAERLACARTHVARVLYGLTQAFRCLGIARDALEVLRHLVDARTRILDIRERLAQARRRRRVACEGIEVRHHMLDIPHRAVHRSRERHEIRRDLVDIPAVLRRRLLEDGDES